MYLLNCWGNYIERRWILYFILVGYDYVLNSRELISWMCANLNVYLITRANNNKLSCPKFWIFLFSVNCDFFF